MHCSWNKDRVEMLQKIESKINKSLLNGFYISDDKNRNGVWWNCKEAWKMVPDDSTHHIVLQDDMIPCDNFIETLLELIYINPDNIIHIFGTNECADYFYSKGYSWFVSRDGTWGGSVILPKKHFEWYKLADEIVRDHPRLWDDTRFNFYCTFTKNDIWHITPTLLQHEGYDKSLINHPASDFRKANCFIGNNVPNNWKNLKVPYKNNYACIYNRHTEITYLNLKRPYNLELLDFYNLKDTNSLKMFDVKASYDNIFPEIRDLKIKK